MRKTFLNLAHQYYRLAECGKPLDLIGSIFGIAKSTVSEHIEKVVNVPPHYTKEKRTMANTEKYPAIYEDDEYRVIADTEEQMVRLIMFNRRVSLAFSYDEWWNLQGIVSGIEIPDELNGAQVVLYEDDPNLVDTDGEIVFWYMGDHMVSLGWHIAGWEKFREMVKSVRLPFPDPEI